MAKTSIEWATRVWNPTLGCDRVSAGCNSCYAIRFARRFDVPGGRFEGLTKVGDDGRLDWTGKIALHPERLDAPLRWRVPERVFVDSMSDLFHAEVPTDFIAEVFAVMAQAKRHTFQVLTKRPQRMKRLLTSFGFRAQVDEACKWAALGPTAMRGLDANAAASWPLPNVWMGVSVENQEAAYRINFLEQTPATVRFLSCEPLIGPLDLGQWLRCCPSCGSPRSDRMGDSCGYCQAYPGVVAPIHWVIAGGESGPGFRPLNVDWVRALRDQCEAAGVPFFFKQVGGRTPKAGGRLLDGREWSEFPAAEIGDQPGMPA